MIFIMKLNILILSIIFSITTFAANFKENINFGDLHYTSKYQNSLNNNDWRRNFFQLGNSYYTEEDDYFNSMAVEIDIIGEELESFNSLNIKFDNAGSDNYNNIPSPDADIMRVVIYDSYDATGHAFNDYYFVFTRKNVLYTSEYFSLSDLMSQDGVTLENLDIDVSDDSFITFAFVPNQTAMPILTGGKESGGLGLEINEEAINFTIEGSTATIPESSTYATILGLFAFIFVIYRSKYN